MNVFVPVQVTDPSLCRAPTPSGDHSAQPVMPEQPRAPASHTAAGQIEVELPDGSKLRVGEQVSLTTLRRVIAALRG